MCMCAWRPWRLLNSLGDNKKKCLILCSNQRKKSIYINLSRPNLDSLLAKAQIRCNYNLLYFIWLTFKFPMVILSICRRRKNVHKLNTIKYKWWIASGGKCQLMGKRADPIFWIQKWKMILRRCSINTSIEKVFEYENIRHSSRWK